MLNRTLSILLILLLFSGARAQDLYFPPVASDGVWETLSPEELGWCSSSIPPLLTYLEETNSKAFIVLKDGKIVMEEYFNEHSQSDPWYWASAGKSLTAFLIGIAQEEGHLSIDEPSSNYLGEGWTSCTPEQESAITIRHQLTMTTGLDDGVENLDCTNPECLQYLADPGTRWSYHNAPYTLLDSVIYYSTGQNINSFVLTRLTNSTGISGAYLPIDFNNVFFSSARVMARFGLLALNRGTWDNEVILGDMEYFDAMTTSSQNLNPSYGYLWWLAGQSGYKLPGSQFLIPGSAVPNAPDDMFAALGKNGQIINVVPSMNLVLIRMGDAPDISLPVSNVYNNEIWEYLNEIMCATANTEDISTQKEAHLYPNPAENKVTIDLPNNALPERVIISSVTGQHIQTLHGIRSWSIADWQPGMYFIDVQSGQQSWRLPLLKP